MNSALKPVMPQPGVPQPGGQPSPAKGNVASSVNHAVGHPQGAQNSLHHGNNLVGQNLTHHAPAPQLPPHAAPSMAPVSANMAQMAQNMSHHGNLSHVTQNSVPAPSVPVPSKSTTSPLSLVQDKVNTSSQPLALTRTPEKKEPDSTGTANGTIESPKSGSSTPLKPQNPESNKDKQDIAKTSPSTPKPPEKPSSAPATPQKIEPSNPVHQDGTSQPKVATANEPPEKSPSKPTELKPSPAADVAPSQSDMKPETANDSQSQEKPSTTTEEIPETVKSDTPKEPKEEIKVGQTSSEDKKEDKVDTTKQEEQSEKPVTVEKVEEKKAEVKQVKSESKPKSTLKLATVTPPIRKRRQASLTKANDASTPAKKVAEGDGTPDSRGKRNRTKVQLYQSPTPELAMATKLSASAGRSTPTKPNDDKLIVIYKNEYLAVRNAEGGFYVCQAMQNVYRTTRKIKIRWLSQDKTADPSGETYKPDFYDITDMECVLTTLSLTRAPSGGGAQVLKPAENARAKSILQRALQAENCGGQIELTEEHPDGLDLSLYTDESQLEKKSRKRNSSKSSPRKHDNSTDDDKEAPTPVKKARTTPKRSPKSARKTKSSLSPNKQTNKRKSSGSKPVVATTSKTATAVTETPKKSTPPKRTNAKQIKEKETPTPTRKGGRRSTKEVKSSPIVPTPSTSTGKTTRTPRKPPANK